jgi:hypothetical protein
VAPNSSTRGITTISTSTPANDSGESNCLNSSRISLLARFLLTESPSFRDATIPSLVRDACPLATSSVRNRPRIRCPLSNTLWNSARRLSRRFLPNGRDAAASLGLTWATCVPARGGMVRTKKLSGACDPWPDGVSAPADRSWYSYARENHECEPCAGGSAGTCVS